jgi:serine/threonine protein kinase/formylglycine-generating enzyme required for sulfatase activity
MADDPLAPLVRAWQDALASGRNVTVDELCRDCPELAPRLTARLMQLRATGPMAAGIDPFGTLGSANTPGGFAQTPADPAPGDGANRKRIGNYQLLEPLGEGGMGVVYRAEELHLGRQVAVKLIHPEKVFNPRIRERFLKEAKAQAGIDHENVVPIYAAGEQDRTLYLVMPLLRGETLKEYLDRDPRPPIPFLLKVGAEMAEGLAAAHARGVIHRDVKPSNVWLEGDPGAANEADRVRRCKLLDFGLARQTNPQAQMLTGTQEMLGTPAYMSPEQLEGGGNVDPRTDLFSLGVVLYEMASGRHPFHDKTSLANTFVNVATLDPPPVQKSNPNVPPALAALINQMLAKSVDDRPASAKEVADRLRQIERRPDAPVPPPPPPPPPPPGRRPWGLIVGGAVAALGLVAVATYLVIPGPDTPPTSPSTPTQATTPATDSGSGQTGTRPTPPGGTNTPPTPPGGGTSTPPTKPDPPTLVEVRIGSEPTGADIALIDPDGRSVPTRLRTPAALSVRPVPQSVELTLDGYEPARQPINPAERTEYAVTLNPATMRLIVRDLPPDATVTFPEDGSARPVKDRPGEFDVRRKPVKVRIEARGYRPATKEVAPPADGGKQVAVDGALQRDSVPTELTNRVGMTLKLIPAGQFRMGIDGKPDDPRLRDQEPRDVEITRSYYLGVTEVTVGQFRQFVEDEGYRTDAEKSAKGGWGYVAGKLFEQHPRFSWAAVGYDQTDDHPVVNVSWNDATAFCEWLSRKEKRRYRLPTEAEWELAARAGEAGTYPFGNSATQSLRGRANLADQSFRGRLKIDFPDQRLDNFFPFDDRHPFTAPVRSYQPNRNGLFDMFGNVSELCRDWYGVLPVPDPKDPERTVPAAPGIKVARGGSFLAVNTADVAVRTQVKIGEPSADVGFRVMALVDDK